MKRIVLLFVCLGLLMTSCGATMKVQGTAPNMDNDGTCGVPLLYPMALPNLMLKMHFAWSGVVSGEDSIGVTPGQPFVYTRSAPPGAYVVRVWASDLGGVGCDTTITVNVKGKPAKPSEVR